MPRTAPNEFTKAMRFTAPEKAEIYNALADRCNALRESIAAPGVPERVREALTQSLARCEKLAEVFE